MKNIKSNYAEDYGSHRILIHGVGGEWWWIVLVDGTKAKNSPKSYYSIETAISNARKFIDSKLPK